jgi:hypothetical protein
MIVILIVLRDQPLRKWPLGLTLNTILSKIASAALILPISEAIGQLKWSWFHGKTSRNALDFEIFDKASRGAWGSFLLLFRTKGRSLAAMGAILTLLLLAIDTFFQQVTDLPTGWTLYGEGLVPRVVRYESDNQREFQTGVELVANDQRMQPISDSFLSANGTMPIVFGNGVRPDIPLSCPTSNCTWPPVNTLGLCGQCIEAPELLTYACHDTIVDWISTLNTTVSTYPNATVCGYFLNATTSDRILMSGYTLGPDGSPDGETLMMRTLPLLSNPMRIPLWGGSVHFKQVRNPVIDVLIASIANKSQVHANVAPMLQECVLEWCVKTIESYYWEGSYQENVTNFYTNHTPRTGRLWETQQLEDNVFMTDYYDNITITTLPEGSNISEPGWGVSNNTMLSTITVLDRIFPAFATISNDSMVPFLRWRLGHLTQVRTKALKAIPWASPDDLVRHMERLSIALTNVMRSGTTSGEPISGKAFLAETYVAVYWAWLAFPIAMLGMSIVFLVATIVKTSQSENKDIGMWKTSAMPALFYSLPQDARDKLSSSSKSDSETRNGAPEVRIRLVSNQGWRVSGQAHVSPIVGQRGRRQAPAGWI